jgi:hypothetical protein
MYPVDDTAVMKVQAVADGLRALIQKHDMVELAGHLRGILRS